MTRRLALVTGASAGIGAAFARLLAAKGYDLALTARRVERLEALASELRAGAGAEVLVAPADLSRMDGAASVLDQLARAGREVDVLINNAGYGLAGAFASTPWSEQQAFLQLMVVAPCELAHKTLPGMIARRYGRIVNVASVAGLIPGAAGHTLYGGTKSLLIKFSESLNLEAGARGVHVSALCPGFTYSEFHDVNGSRAQVSAATPKWAWLQAERVVEEGWRAVEANQAVCVPSRRYRLLCGGLKLVPDRLALEIMRRQGPRIRRA